MIPMINSNDPSTWYYLTYYILAGFPVLYVVLVIRERLRK